MWAVGVVFAYYPRVQQMFKYDILMFRCNISLNLLNYLHMKGNNTGDSNPAVDKPDLWWTNSESSGQNIAVDQCVSKDPHDNINNTFELKGLLNMS